MNFNLHYSSRLYSRISTQPTDLSTQPVYCTYLPEKQSHSATSLNVRTGQPDEISTASTQSSSEAAHNIPSDADIIYASYPNQMMANRTAMLKQNMCTAGQVACFGGNQCVAQEKWCDSMVDCMDGSDETACSCKSRLSKERICDGYVDCPMGSDEMGCFGCDKFSYSCHSNRHEFEQAKQSPFQMCYSAVDKCDGVETCLNGKDEQDCVMIVRTIGEHLVS